MSALPLTPSHTQDQVVLAPEFSGASRQRTTASEEFVQERVVTRKRKVTLKYVLCSMVLHTCGTLGIAVCVYLFLGFVGSINLIAVRANHDQAQQIRDYYKSENLQMVAEIRTLTEKLPRYASDHQMFNPELVAVSSVPSGTAANVKERSSTKG